MELTGLSAQYHTHVWAKLEARNPGGSIKDRTAYALLDDAQARGLLHTDTVIIEATSGNTGIALAMACAVRHLKLVIFMPEGQSAERKQLFWAYGATVIETPADEHTLGAIRRAKELESTLPDGLMLRQHENPANPKIHEQTTGPEIWEQTAQKVRVFVAGVGTGGTITGVGRYLKHKDPTIRIVAVEPEASAVLSGKEAGSHQIQGIGSGFVPDILDMTVVDQIVAVPDSAARACAQQLPREEGILAGLTSGATYWAAGELLKQGLENIVVIFADSGERYLSMKLYEEPSDVWLRQRVPAFFDKDS
jgi:cysteine synthase A